MKAFQLALVFVALTAFALAVPRTWTSSTDGRTFEGELIAKSEKTATIRRTADKKDFVVPLPSLCEADRAFVSAATLRDFAAELAALQKQMPPPPSAGGDVTPELRELHARYASDIRFLRVNTLAQGMARIRTNITRDLDRLNAIARTDSRVNGLRGKREGVQSAAAESGILSARAGLTWLNSTFTPYLKRYDALAF